MNYVFIFKNIRKNTHHHKIEHTDIRLYKNNKFNRNFNILLYNLVHLIAFKRLGINSTNFFVVKFGIFFISTLTSDLLLNLQSLTQYLLFLQLNKSKEEVTFYCSTSIIF